MKEVQILIGNSRIAISISPNVNAAEVLASAEEISPLARKVFVALLSRGPRVQILPFPKAGRIFTDDEIIMVLAKMLGIN